MPCLVQQRTPCLTQWLPDGCLVQAIRAERFAGHNQQRVLVILRDIALALKEMHDRGPLHVYACVHVYVHGRMDVCV